ncbi:uncharacterized protein MONBRDRAFT_28535 [Monosiga brevicollis MX1]|uniref:Aminotransferase class V domain-containing protein n=1 Tax=Monosiga brevicollis TaxID=81824 RepID=A9V8G3_MONBE|nr:uncharacterized protein MONBRDRAFT_28535 [Monosiga brevicollis MX1]EDQ86077.1 predicted protein [Monosiga brevicollis MX1]|eukprot:XP_001749002.1 hypothetical protein [Monosiga brevicollis MX1]
MIYADFTASGRSLRFVEDYLHDKVMPLYANTHTEASVTGRVTTEAREEARRLVVEACGGNTNEHAAIFTGSGSTAAIYKFMGLMNLMPRARASSSRAVQVEKDGRRGVSIKANAREPGPPRRQRPVIFISEYEHHSNDLPWREAPVDLVRIISGSDGALDLQDLEEQVKKYRRRPLLIGSFSAASNVTGIITPVREAAKIMHKYGGLACFDYAASAPYVPINMGSRENGDDDYLDAIYISPHKFVGGPGSPGVLILRRSICTNLVPVMPGGGTVLLVEKDLHVYTQEVEHREEGGTPDIMGSIRCGLIFSIKQRLGPDFIVARERELIRRANAIWEPIAHQMVLLGPDTEEKLTVSSFLLRCAGKMLHYNFVVSLLNDIFGIQTRGGCSCAGPYVTKLLQPTDDMTNWMHHEARKGHFGAKLGWTRLNFPYFFTDEQADYVSKAVALVAVHGWRMLKHYNFDVVTGFWTHKDFTPAPRQSLLNLFNESSEPSRDPLAVPDYDALLREGEIIMTGGKVDEWSEILRQTESRHSADSGVSVDFTVDDDSPRWYLLPSDMASFSVTLSFNKSKDQSGNSSQNNSRKSSTWNPPSKATYTPVARKDRKKELECADGTCQLVMSAP